MAANNEEPLNLNGAYIQVILNENGYVAFNYVQFGNLVRWLRSLLRYPSRQRPVEHVTIGYVGFGGNLPQSLRYLSRWPEIGYAGYRAIPDRPLRHLNWPAEHVAVASIGEIEIEDNRGVPSELTSGLRVAR